ncbi:MAG: hypothetical protein K6F87_00970 [Lachnospiraceae bacterium]|nr:hypothetical protein [Lachnospiraceae bacterium]
MFRRNKIYSIDKKAANEALQNVFAACEQTPNTQSLDALLFKNIANTTLVKAGKWMSIALLVLILLCPIVFYMAGKNQPVSEHKADIRVTSHYLDEESGYFVMTVEGTDIDFDGIYAKKENGSKIYPAETGPEGTVKFRFESGTLNIFIPDTEGGVVQAVLSK